MKTMTMLLAVVMFLGAAAPVGAVKVSEVRNFQEKSVKKPHRIAVNKFAGKMMDSAERSVRRLHLGETRELTGSAAWSVRGKVATMTAVRVAPEKAPTVKTAMLESAVGELPARAVADGSGPLDRLSNRVDRLVFS